MGTTTPASLRPAQRLRLRNLIAWLGTTEGGDIGRLYTLLALSAPPRTPVADGVDLLPAQVRP